jgi:hypothetical protein
MVVLDADVIVTRPLTPLLDEASRGWIVVFQDYKEPARFFSDWSSLGLGTPRRQPYVNSGHLIFSSATGSDLPTLFTELQERLGLADTYFGGGADVTNPFFYLDQDILNAILCTRFDGQVMRLEGRLAPFPPFTGLEVSDAAQLTCTYPDGTSPYLLHHVLRKPWLVPMDRSPYSELFTRVVTGPDVPLRLGRRDIPLRLRGSLPAPLEERLLSLQVEAHRRLRGKLGVRPQLERLVRKAGGSGVG